MKYLVYSNKSKNKISKFQIFLCIFSLISYKLEKKLYSNTKISNCKKKVHFRNSIFLCNFENLMKNIFIFEIMYE